MKKLKLKCSEKHLLESLISLIQRGWECLTPVYMACLVLGEKVWPCGTRECSFSENFNGNNDRFTTLHLWEIDCRLEIIHYLQCRVNVFEFPQGLNKSIRQFQLWYDINVPFLDLVFKYYVYCSLIRPRLSITELFLLYVTTRNLVRSAAYLKYIKQSLHLQAYASVEYLDLSFPGASSVQLLDDEEFELSCWNKPLLLENMTSINEQK